MKLHRLSVRDFKGIDECDVDVPESGILVLEGRNEIGKSSMLEALDLLLEHKDSSRRAQIRAAQPVGRDVGPVAEVELSTGPYRFTYRKRWLRQPSTELDIIQPRRAHLVGDEAHQRVRSMLAETADMCLWRALRLLQATPLTQGDFAGSSALAAALEAAAGRTSEASTPGASEVAETLLAASEVVYQRYFTARNGQPTGELRAAIERHDRAQQALAAAQAAVDEVAQDVGVHEQVQSELSGAREQLERTRAERDRLTQQWAQVREIVERLAQAEGRRDELALAVSREAERSAERAEAVATLLARRKALAAAQEQTDLVREQLEPLIAGLAAAQEAHDAALRRERAARARLDMLTRRLARRRDEADLEALAARVQRIDACARALAQARAAVDANPVTVQLLRDLDSAQQELDTAVATQRVGSAAITLRALGPTCTVQIDGAPLDLAVGDPWEAPIAHVMRVLLPGEVEVELRPEAGAAQHAQDVAQAQGRRDELLVLAAVADVPAAREAHERRRDVEAELRREQERLDILLEGANRSDLVEGMERLQATLDTQAVDDVARDTGAEDPDSDPAALLATAQLEEAASRDDAARCEARRQALREQEHALRLELVRGESLLSAVTAQLAEQEASVQVARTARPDAELDVALEHAQEQLTAAQKHVDAQQALLAGHDIEGVELLHDGATAEIDGLQERVRMLEEERIRVEARLEHAGSQGRAEALDAARTQEQHARARLATLRRHAEGARLLRTTLTTRSQAAKQAYVRPFSDAVCRLGRIVYGTTFDVDVDDDLTINARIVDGRRIPYDALSTGAKEQLAIITRLACASIIDPEHGAPVVIDDALGYSDPEKLRRVCATFGRLGAGAQVILLTCTPGRYASVGESHVVRL